MDICDSFRHTKVQCACVFICMLLLCSCGRKDDTTTKLVTGYAINTETVSPEYVVNSNEELENGSNQLPDDSFEGRFEFFNPWRKGYFHNDWGEANPNSPYLYTTLNGTSWDIHIDYSIDSEYPCGTFRFFIVDTDGHITSSYGPVNILVRGSDGVTRSVTVAGTIEYITFVEDPSTVLALKQLFDQETFDIQMQFEKYNERYTTNAKWNCEPGFFQYAIETML